MTITVETGPTAAPEPVRRSGQSRFGALARYLGVRALLIIPTAWFLVTLVFFLMRGIGDPITASAGGRLTPAQIDEALITPDAKGATLPLTANFWAAHRRVIEGTLVDIVALSVSGDLLISGLAYQAYRELVLNEDLYNG